jgi:hypothetical protein
MTIDVFRIVKNALPALVLFACCAPREVHNWTIINSDELINAERIAVVGAQTELTNEECIVPAIKGAINALNLNKWNVVSFEEMRRRKEGYLVPITLPPENCFPQAGYARNLCSAMEPLNRKAARKLRSEFKANLALVIWTEECGSSEKEDVVFYQIYRTVDGAPVARFKIIAKHVREYESSGGRYDVVTVIKSDYSSEKAMVEVGRAAAEALSGDLHEYYRQPKR